jgi:hypothetical protein
MRHAFEFSAEIAEYFAFESKNSRPGLLTHKRLQASRSADQASVACASRGLSAERACLLLRVERSRSALPGATRWSVMEF